MSPQRTSASFTAFLSPCSPMVEALAVIVKHQCVTANPTARSEQGSNEGSKIDRSNAIEESGLTR